ncbi:cytochrome d ubiquinol oxidase subunit II [Desulfurispirillum indicum]|uniref:Cytochrome d ubiquinol oxidase, subunit II n=1 Tax=Desulfurispirillum indicum (strain ATCC BAA-1389 / DSM 22839 / S5) TaxID=653733 RepID=E6W289_DESIS|nr:cytochrome d ubiquinol oxidase subunit II [Desulfurispirillum indicum]ADU65547.1 cytochrome d ubiquinol oxidase, subunit II [Desulfurispirillum indicum S5]UCZ57619.1 cytochrome d ubiquinol oxidase subunit II [Desulfurispirillum indicum]
MFGSFEHLTLQQYWWIILSLLAGLLVFMMFVQGGQTLLRTLARDEEEKGLMINSLGRKWELGFTTLVLFGGAFFAAFPLFYATSFGGAYFVWMAILYCFVLQAVSYEFRRKPGNLLGAGTYETFLLINGSIGVILIGTAVGTLFSGAAFSLNEYNLSQWQNDLRGLEAAFNLFNVSLGLAVFFLGRMLGAMYFMNNIDHQGIRERGRKSVLINTILFLPFFLIFAVWLLLRDGYAYDPLSGVVFLESYKYLKNFLAMPVVLVMFLAGVLLVLYSVFITVFKKSLSGIWFGGPGAVLVVMSLFLNLGLNNTAFYPSYYDLQSSLTIVNSSASHYTLTVMSYVSLVVPVVLGYIILAWRAMDRKKITAEEISQNKEAY